MKLSPTLKSRLIPIAGFSMLLVALVAVNVLAAFLPMRVDVTEEGLYTLSPGTREILAGIEEPITLKLYYSQDLPDIPVTFKTYSTKVVELLREYAANAPGGRVRLEIFDPAPDTEDEEWATRYGLSPARLPNGGTLYFGLVAVAADREAIVPFLDPRRERFLEYDVSETVARVLRVARPRIGVMSYLPIGTLTQAPMMGQQGGQGNWAVVQELQKNFDLQAIEAGGLLEIPPDLKLLLLIHPKLIPSRVSYALDQFVLRGGKLVVLIDPNARLDPSGGGRFGAPTSSSLDELFAAWGLKFDKTLIVGDRQLATRVNSPEHGVVEYPIWITLTAQYLNRENVITSELEEVTLIDAGRLEMADGAQVSFTPLITSSPNSGMVDMPSVRLMNPVAISTSIKVDDTPKVLAALLSGRFPSAYPDGPPTPPIDAANPEEGALLAKRAAAHLREATAESSVVVVADADFIADQFSVQQTNFFGNVVTQPVNDNLSVVLNSVEYLAGSQALIHIRSRGKFSRPFTRVADLQVKAAEQFIAEEQRLSQTLEELKAKINALEGERPQGENLMLSPQQLDVVRNFRAEEQATRRALRDVRRLLRQDIEALGNRLLAVNLLAMPVLVAIFGFVVIIRRSRRSGGRR